LSYGDLWNGGEPHTERFVMASPLVCTSKIRGTSGVGGIFVVLGVRGKYDAGRVECIAMKCEGFGGGS